MSECGRCRYFRPYVDGGLLGSCRRYAPGIGWRDVNNDDWCGEWKPTAVVEMTRRKPAKPTTGE